MDYLIYERPEDKGISYITPVSKEIIENHFKVHNKDDNFSFSNDEYKKHIEEKSIPEGITKYKWINKEGLPTSQEFRNAWVWNESDKIEEHLQKSIDIKTNQIRVQREDMLKDLDKQFMIALEKNDTKSISDISTQKQKLRDITNIFKSGSITSVEQIRGKTIQDFI